MNHKEQIIESIIDFVSQFSEDTILCTECLVAAAVRIAIDCAPTTVQALAVIQKTIIDESIQINADKILEAAKQKLAKRRPNERSTKRDI